MPSTLAWLDHDASAQDRARRILALFQEKSTQDQLGLGGVRDSFADTVFPGTSTIQTRLRYFLFIPWMYRRIEEEEVPSAKIAAMGRERELSLIEPLLSEDEEGVFGRTAGGDLKRLPSDVYWGGLGSWGSAGSTPRERSTTGRSTSCIAGGGAPGRARVPGRPGRHGKCPTPGSTRCSAR